MGNAKGKASKNNPDVKTKEKNNKIHDSSFCEKACKEHCLEYEKYIELLNKGKILKGITCKFYK